MVRTAFMPYGCTLRFAFYDTLSLKGETEERFFENAGVGGQPCPRESGPSQKRYSPVNSVTARRSHR